MTDEILIDGVKLTRQQVEIALAKMNQPTGNPFKPGEIVRLKGSHEHSYVVVGAREGEQLRRLYSGYDETWNIPVIDLRNGSSIFFNSRAWLLERCGFERLTPGR